jgi:drug/metabolite transporter (DMT)-like permease
VLIGLLAAFAGAVSFGVASLLQAVAARREAPTPGLDPRLLLRMLRYPAYVGGLALNLAGFVFHLVSLRLLPLFLAQAVTASSVAVTAVLSATVLKTRFGTPARLAVLGVCAGLTLLTGAAAETESTPTTTLARAGLVAAGLALAGAGALVGRVAGARGAAVLGILAGLAYTVTALAVRVVPDLEPLTILTDPSTYALILCSVVGALLYATALQRGTVMNATSAMIVAQTVGPAVVGMVALGDSVRSGWLPAAALGLALAVAGALTLVRQDPDDAAVPVREGA